MLSGGLNGRGVWGRMYTCTCKAESLYCSPETIKILLIGYTPIENKKFKEKKDLKKIMVLLIIKQKKTGRFTRITVGDIIY